MSCISNKQSIIHWPRTPPLRVVIASCCNNDIWVTRHQDCLIAGFNTAIWTYIYIRYFLNYFNTYSIRNPGSIPWSLSFYVWCKEILLVCVDNNLSIYCFNNINIDKCVFKDVFISGTGWAKLLARSLLRVVLYT